MAINLSDVIAEIESRYNNIDSSTSVLEQFRINAARDRLNNSGVYAQTYKSTGHLPTITDSAYLGSIFQVEVDNVFGDSDGAFYMASARDSGWLRMTTLQDSDEASIEAPGGEPAGPSVPVYAGTQYGYVYNNNPAPDTSVFNRYPFASDANATDLGTDVGTPTIGRTRMFGGGGNTKGFHAGGFNGSSPTAPGQALTYIASFPYASGTPLADTPYQLNVKRQYGHNEMIGNRTYIYYAGGQRTTPSPTAIQNVIEKTPEVVEANAADVGDLISVQYYGAAHSSDTHGYLSGGFIPGYSNRIEKWTFASDANATDVGDLTVARAYQSGHSSSTDGYATGGVPTTNGIEKFPFASDGNSADTGQNIVGTNYGQTGTTSDTHGYLNGGQGPPGVLDVIEKFPFADDAGATDVGDLAKITAYDQATSQN